jgi:hypothetical protein
VRKDQNIKTPRFELEPMKVYLGRKISGTKAISWMDIPHGKWKFKLTFELQGLQPSIYKPCAILRIDFAIKSDG